MLRHEGLDGVGESRHDRGRLVLLGLRGGEFLGLLALERLEVGFLALELGLLLLELGLLLLEVGLQGLDLLDHVPVLRGHLVEVVDVARELLEGGRVQKKVDGGLVARLVGGAHAVAELLLLGLDVGLGLGDLVLLGGDGVLRLGDLLVQGRDLALGCRELGRGGGILLRNSRKLLLGGVVLRLGVVELFFGLVGLGLGVVGLLLGSYGDSGGGLERRGGADGQRRAHKKAQGIAPG